MSFEIDWVTGAAEFAGLGGEWDALLGVGALPFDLHCWYSAWWEAFGGGNELAVCTVRQDGELAGVYPLMVEGGELVALANVHSCSYRPIARDGAALAALEAAAFERGRGGVSLQGVPVGDPSIQAFEEAARAASAISLVEPSYGSPFVAIEGDLETWREENKPRWKAPLEKKRRKMGRDHEAEFVVVEAPAELEAELEDGFRVEASGWKGEEGTAILSAPETANFYRAVAGAFQARDELRLSRIALDGNTVAFDFCLLHGGRLYTLKGGYDEEFRNLAPGLVLRLSILEHCFELGLESHELLGDEAEWKSRFSSGVRPHANVYAYSRRPLDAMRYTYRSKLRPRLRDAYRRVRPRSR